MKNESIPFQVSDSGAWEAGQPLRVVGEVLDWERHSPEVLQQMRDHLETFKQLGVEAIND